MTTKCPVCDLTLPLGVQLEEEEKETYFGSNAVGGELTIRLPFCNQSADCNRVTAANKMDELAQPFLEAVGNG